MHAAVTGMQGCRAAERRGVWEDVMKLLLYTSHLGLDRLEDMKKARMFVRSIVAAAMICLPISIQQANGQTFNFSFNTTEGPDAIAVDSGKIYVSFSASNDVQRFSDSGSFEIEVVNILLNNPRNVAFDSLLNIFIADSSNHRILKCSPDLACEEFAGGLQGFQDGVGQDAQFNSPRGLVIDNTDTLYIADHFNHSIRSCTTTPLADCSTVAGDGTAGFR